MLDVPNDYRLSCIETYTDWQYWHSKMLREVAVDGEIHDITWLIICTFLKHTVSYQYWLIKLKSGTGYPEIIELADNGAKVHFKV